MIDMRCAETRRDFEAVDVLLAEMADWDIQASLLHDVPTERIRETFYSDSVDDMMEKFTAPAGRVLLAGNAEGVGGCIVFARTDDETGEVYKLFVRPQFRGKGIARTLLSTALDELKSEGIRTVRLETANFMTDAITLYRSFDFTPCPAFRPVWPEFEPSSLFFKRKF
jgi:GNAT superfamily N-acetyltransferase